MRKMPWGRLEGKGMRGRAGRRVVKMRLFWEEGRFLVKTVVVGGVRFATHPVALFTTFDHHLSVSPS